MFKCPNCNGSLYFDAKKQLLACQHCGSEIPVKEYNTDNTADSDMSVYTCHNCGAQLVSPDQSAVAFCSYCGSEQILEEKLHDKLQPKKIIPFQLSKEDCIDRYNKMIKSALYVPSEFKDPSFIERFRGIYIPFYQFDTKLTDTRLSIPGENVSRKGNYRIVKKYDFQVDVGQTVQSVPFDASSAFDDNIAKSIEPYKKEHFKDYHPGYLAGFYADVADVNPDIYMEDAKKEAITATTESIKEAAEKKRITLDMPSDDKKLKEMFKPEIINKKPMLLPVWFLTWRKNNRVAYIIANGQTGEISYEIPVSYKSFFLYTMLTAVALFVVFTFLLTITAPTALLITMNLATIAIMVYQRLIKKLHDKENHIFDRGYFLEGKDTVISQKKADRIRRFREEDPLFIFLFFGFFILAMLQYLGFDWTEGLPDEKAFVASWFLVPIIAWNLIRALSFVFHVKDKSVVLDVAAMLAGVLAGYYVLATDQVNDYMYYGGSILCIFGTLIACMGMIRKYNAYCTRPLPTFFDRTGGSDL